MVKFQAQNTYLCHMPYPIFRKYPNGSSIFKITSETEFIEVQRLGNHYTAYTITARIFPDRQRIQDMIAQHDGHWLSATADEFNTVFAQV